MVRGGLRDDVLGLQQAHEAYITEVCQQCLVQGEGTWEVATALHEVVKVISRVCLTTQQHGQVGRPLPSMQGEIVTWWSS